MKVKLFGGLRQKAGVPQLSGSGSTIREVLQQINAENESLGAAIFDTNSGELRPHVRVMVNGLDSELMAGLETAVTDEDQLAIFPPIAGG